jgi:hypothetical protein
VRHDRRAVDLENLLGEAAHARTGARVARDGGSLAFCFDALAIVASARPK